MSFVAREQAPNRALQRAVLAWRARRAAERLRWAARVGSLGCLQARGVGVSESETATFLRRGILLSLTLCMLAALGACGSGPSNALPEEVLGKWYFLGSSGGIDGDRGNDEATGHIVLHEGRMDVHGAGGALTQQVTFSPSREKTIYSDEDLWILNFDGGEARVVLVSPDGQTMSLAPNAYDSIGQDYSRTR